MTGRKEMEMEFTRDELKTIEYVMGEVLANKNGRLHYEYGNMTIELMQKIHSKLHYMDYCERHGIKYEDMTEDDFMRAYEEEDE